MATLRRLLLRLYHFIRPAAGEAELDRELRSHLALLEDEHLRRGLTPEAARREARRALGGLAQTKEFHRETRTLGWLDDLWRDLLYAVRTLRRTPGFAVVVVLTLALGIGANTAIFSVMDAVMLRFLPVQNPQELVSVQAQRPSGTPEDGFTNALWEAVRDQQHVFRGTLAFSAVQQVDLGSGGAVQPVDGVFVSGDYFTTLGVSPAAGRLISTDDDHRGCVPLAVLSYSFWQSYFGGLRTAVGSAVFLRGHPFQIIGVAASHFYGVQVGKSFDVAMPLCASAPFDKRNLGSRSRWWLRVMGRVGPELTPEQLQSGLGLISPSVMRAALPDGDAAMQERFLSRRLIAAPAATGASDLRGTVRDPLHALMAIVAVVLIIACANIASLLIARTTMRSKEMALRRALGASRGRLIQQLITESLLLSVLGAAVGLWLARWGGTILVRSLATGGNSIALDLSLDPTVFGFSVVVTLLTGLLIGIYPAVRSARTDLAEAIKTRIASTGGRGRFRVGRWIVAGQVALSLVLLVSGVLLVRTFIKLMSVDLGFDQHHVLIASIRPPWWAADDVQMSSEHRAFVDQEIESRLGALPGVISASRSFIEPLGDDNWVDEIETDVSPTLSREGTYFNFVTPTYFETLGTPILAGRNFNDGDTRTSPSVGIVNETLARSYFAGLDPLGHRIAREVDGRPSWIEVVGVMKDSKYETVQEATRPTIFLPAPQAFEQVDVEQFELSSTVAPESIVPSVRLLIAELNPRAPVEFHTMAEHVDDSVAQERVVAELAGLFSVLALVLAMIGLYGALSYAVTQRQVEFGVRMALGAQPASILRVVMQEVALVLAVGIGSGIAISFAAVTVLRKLLFGLAPHDPATTILSVSLLAVAALVAGYLPARRATRVDPLVALRQE